MSEPVFGYGTGDADPAAVNVGLPTEDRLVLDGPEGRHAADVRRLRVGELLVLTDGRGSAARCRVVGARKGELDLEVVDRWMEQPPAPRLVVVQALAKGDRGETAVETLTEVGVDVIVPWAASRSVTRWTPERAPKALARWRTAAHEAAKQARRCRWPEVTDLVASEGVCGLLADAALGLVLHEEATLPLASVPVPVDGDFVVVVGPEGGIAPEELSAFIAAGARPVHLGPTVLRTSTAGTAAAAAILSRTSRWGPPFGG